MHTATQATLVAASTLAGLALGNATGHASGNASGYKEMLTTPHAVFVSTNMPRCSEEDGSGPAGRPCTWNLGGDGGTRHYLAYWVGKRELGTHWRIHYLWPTSPVRTHPHRRWVTERQAESFADTANAHHSPKWWTRCYVQYRRGTDRVRCPNGQWWSAR